MHPHHLDRTRAAPQRARSSNHQRGNAVNTPVVGTDAGEQGGFFAAQAGHAAVAAEPVAAVVVLARATVMRFREAVACSWPQARPAVISCGLDAWGLRAGVNDSSGQAPLS
ncbi:hypothetical protein ACFQZC_00435 [Streptacidiphilus monticola]